MGAVPCPRCKVDTVKTSGCNHMTCQACGAEWCWLCRRIFGPGGEELHYAPFNVLGCPGQQMNENLGHAPRRVRQTRACVIRVFMVLLGLPLILAVFGLLLATGLTAVALLVPINLVATPCYLCGSDMNTDSWCEFQFKLLAGQMYVFAAIFLILPLVLVLLGLVVGVAAAMFALNIALAPVLIAVGFCLHKDDPERRVRVFFAPMYVAFYAAMIGPYLVFVMNGGWSS